MKGAPLSSFRFRFEQASAVPVVSLSRLQVYYALPMTAVAGPPPPPTVWSQCCPEVATRVSYGGPGSAWVRLLPANDVIGVTTTGTSRVALTRNRDMWAVDLPASIAAFSQAGGSAGVGASTAATATATASASAAVASQHAAVPPTAPAVPGGGVPAGVVSPQAAPTAAHGDGAAASGASRSALEDAVKRLFAQLVRGCGVAGCTNPHCATGSGPCLVTCVTWRVLAWWQCLRYLKSLLMHVLCATNCLRRVADASHHCRCNGVATHQYQRVTPVLYHDTVVVAEPRVV